MPKISPARLNHTLIRSVLVLAIPGLFLKRWLALGAVGVVAIGLGAAFALQIPLGPGFRSFVGTASFRDSSPLIRGGVFIGVGAAIAGAAAFMLARSLAKARLRRRHWGLLDSLYVERVLGAGPKVVAIGGGTGLPTLLRGLKNYTSNITAVVTVADDGGSSGRLRSELGIPPPGDIRNCLVTLADSEALMQQLMDYRFSTNGQLDGHSLGNMLIAATSRIAGDFYQGVVMAGELLAIRGRVIPSTSTDVTLVGSTVSGQRLVGESQVGTAKERLESVVLAPSDAPAHPEAIKAIEEADLIILGPGSLFTSIVPNLLVREIAAGVASARALKMYICNVAEEPGETVGYSVLEHLDVVHHYLGQGAIDLVIANSNLPQELTSPSLRLVEPQVGWKEPALYVPADVIDETAPSRHDASKLAAVIAETYRKHRGARRRLPRMWRGL